jgi:hypothetical protein
MTATYSPAGHEVVDRSANRTEHLCLTASLVISSVGIAVSIIGWWMTRFYNVSAAEEGMRTKDLMSIDWDSSDLPFLLFLMFVAGAAALVFALIGARAVGPNVWKAVVAGMLATSLLMVPVVVAANSLVTAGLWDNVGGD